MQAENYLTKFFISYLLIEDFNKNICIFTDEDKNFLIYIKNIYLYLKAAFSLLFSSPASKPTTPPSSKPFRPAYPKCAHPHNKTEQQNNKQSAHVPPAGNQIRRRHLVRPTGRRERAPPATLQGRWGLSPSRASRPTKHRATTR